MVYGAGVPAGVPFLCTACGGIDSRTPARSFQLKTGPGIAPGLYPAGNSVSTNLRYTPAGAVVVGRMADLKSGSSWIFALPGHRWSGMITIMHDK
jgi:hypothetical protein